MWLELLIHEAARLTWNEAQHTQARGLVAVKATPLHLNLHQRLWVTVTTQQ
jgi:hypothetical protein